MNGKFARLTRLIMPAVVQIYVEGYFGEEIKAILNPRLGDLREWTGSGFFIKCPLNPGIIITNAHVVKNAKTIQIMTMLTSEEKFDAILIGIVKNQEPDIAIIKLANGELERYKKLAKVKLPTLDLCEKDDIARGTLLKAIGYPLGMSEPNITGGEISNFVSGDNLKTKKYVTNAAINPGNSGGPAIDNKGRVIGINTSVYKHSENIGFITPYTFIKIILENFFENDSIGFSEIGGRFQKNSDLICQKKNIKETSGIIVTSLEKDGFLSQVGVMEEDIILAINQQVIDRHGIFVKENNLRRSNIFDIFKLIPIGKNVKLTVFRDGKKIILNGKTMSLSQKKINFNPIIKEREFLEVWGMTIQVLSYEIIEAFTVTDLDVSNQILKNFDEYKERIIITHIDKNSPSYLQEWTIGQILYTCDHVRIKSMDHFISILRSSSKLIKLKSETGTIGYFDISQLDSFQLNLKNPSQYLR